MKHTTESDLTTILGAGFNLILVPTYETCPAADFWTYKVHLERDGDSWSTWINCDEPYQDEYYGSGPTLSESLWDSFNESGPCPAEFSTVISRLWRFLEREFIRTCPAGADWNGKYRSPAFRKAILASADDESRPEIGNDVHFSPVLALVG